MKEPLGSIFISYRRDDAADVAGRIYDRLAQHFGDGSVFKDVDSIPLGVDFRKHLSESVGRCSILLAIIGRQWLTITDDSGRRRLDNPRDFVRIEIEAALLRDIPVIPLLVQGASMPAEETLPPTLHDLAYRNGAPIRRDPDFHRDVDRLVRALDAYLRQPQNEPNVRASEPQRSAPNPASASSAPPVASTSGTRTTQNEATPTTAADYVTRGNDRYAEQDYAGATGDYTQAITLDPKYALAYYNRGVVYQVQSKFDQALQDYTQAITLDPKYALAYYNRGVVYQAQSKLDQALHDYTQAIRLDPSNVDAYYFRGRIYHKQGKLDEALKDYRQVITLEPKHADTYYYLGMMHLHLNNRQAAIADFRKARDLYQNPRHRQDAIDRLKELGAT